MFTTLVKVRPAPKELTREPIRMRVAMYQEGKLLAARGMDAEGDYNSTTISTTLFSQALLDLADEGRLKAGVCNIEDVLQLNDLQSELNRNRIFVRALES